jgi:hypothetical protein
MKTITWRTGLAILAVLIALPLFAQDRGTPAASSGGTAASASASSVSTASHSVAGGSYSSGTSYSAPSRDFGTPSFGGGGGGSVYVPSIPVGSSFSNLNYYQFLGFWGWMRSNYSWLQLMQYGLWDANRYYRNFEPLVTPQMFKLTLNRPLRLSQRMVSAVDELQALLDENKSGKTVSKDQIEGKTQEIRDLAKAIRNDQALAFFDPRKPRDITKGFDNLGQGAINQLRDMVQDLNSQIKLMQSQTATSTVSVESLNSDSFQSLSKGIEKLSRVIEKARS